MVADMRQQTRYIVHCNDSLGLRTVLDLFARLGAEPSWHLNLGAAKRPIRLEIRVPSLEPVRAKALAILIESFPQTQSVAYADYGPPDWSQAAARQAEPKVS